MTSYSEFVINHLAANAQEYCGSDVDTLRCIEELIIDTTYAAIKRAKSRGESKAISDTQTVIERAELGKTSGGIVPNIFRR